MKESLSGLTIKVVAERTGISVHTLRAWERRYGIPRPNRHTNNRYRLYDEQDIANVLWMKRQIEAGLAPAQASLLFQQTTPKPHLTALPPFAEMQDALNAAFLEANEQAAQKILDQAFALFAPEQVALDILQPAMATLGERWAQNEIPIWQEHLASNLVRRKLSAILQAQATHTARQPRLLAACAPAEEHEIGLLIFALLAQQQGWNVTYLGQRTPLTEVVNAARQAKPLWIVVSVTTVIGLASLLPWLMKEHRPAVPLAFGGRLLTQLPALQKRLPGAFLASDLSTATRALTTLEPRREFYTPRRRTWNAVTRLQEQRLTLAATTAHQMAGRAPTLRRGHWHVETLQMIGLYLTDSLAAALAFDVPELMDWERQWLAQILPPRAVPHQAVADYLKLFSQTLGKTLPAEFVSLFKPLLARLANQLE